jgi:3',5'-cyclic AMP phosphodiesterase CpdA
MTGSGTPPPTLFRILHASDFHFGTVADLIGPLDISVELLREDADLHDPDHQRPVSGSGEFSLTALARSIGRLYWLSTHSADVVDAFAQFAFLNQQGYDAVLITGDLATSGSRHELRRAFRYVSDRTTSAYLTIRNKPALGSLVKPILVMPGNHDRYRPLFPHNPGERTFDEIFATHWDVGQGTKVLWSRDRRGQHLAVIGVDLSLGATDPGGSTPPDLFPHLGRGRAHIRRIRTLAEVTDEYRRQKPGAIIVWAVHFQPKAKDGRLALLEEQRLIDAANECDVPVILCGHVHEGVPEGFYVGRTLVVHLGELLHL